MDYTKRLRKYIGRKTDLISDPLDGSTPVILKKLEFKYGETYGTFKAVDKARRTFEVRIGAGDINILEESLKGGSQFLPTLKGFGYP